MTYSLHAMEEIINSAFADVTQLKKPEVQEAVITSLRYLETGKLRVASPADVNADCGVQDMVNLSTWQVHTWVKRCILLAMRMRTPETFAWELHGDKSVTYQGRVYAERTGYCDKFDVRNDLGSTGVRAVFGSIVREGAFVAPGVILMPSFVNIGAFVGAGTMVDTWATVGSCAQVGKNVHLAGGVGIGGVLEPENARPVLIGDNAFLGSRAIVVEGTVVGEGAVLGANVCLTASTPIYDMTTSEKTEYRGFVPPRAVVAAGTRLKELPGGTVPLQCAYIIAYRSEKTDAKVSLNDVLRETGIAV